MGRESEELESASPRERWRWPCGKKLSVIRFHRQGEVLLSIGREEGKTENIEVSRPERKKKKALAIQKIKEKTNELHPHNHPKQKRTIA